MTHYVPKPKILAEIPTDDDCLIEASAGTGKTYTIEHLLVEILLENPKLELSQILLVTFTERATSELKTRIRGIIESVLAPENAEESPPDTPHWEIDRDARNRLQSIMYAFDSASIYTIHGFCNRALSENPFYADRLFEEEHISAKTLVRRAYKQALRERLANEEQFAPYLSAWIDNSRRPFESLVETFVSVFRINAPLRPTFSESKALTYLNKIAQHGPVGQLKAELDETDIHGQTVNTICDRVERLQNALKTSGTRDDLQRLETLLKWLPSDRSTGNYAYLSKKLAGRRLQGQFSRDLQQLLQAIAPVKTAVVQRFKPVVDDYIDEVRQTDGVFCYDDMLKLVQQNLDQSRFRQLLRDQYTFALIDEFQDTDPIQWEIFETLFYESSEHVLHLIGDPKQAIYSFRNADIYTYFDVKKRIRDDGHTIARLNHNYRANASLIEIFNQVFESTEKHEFFTGSNERTSRLKCGHPNWQTYRPDGKPATPCHLVHYPETEDRTKVADLREAYARDYANRIERLLAEPRMQFDRSTEQMQDANTRLAPDDIFVLARRKSECRRIARHLRQRDIPFTFFKQDGLFGTKHAAELLDLLSAVEQPSNRSRRLRAWLTPFFENSLSELPPNHNRSKTHRGFEKILEWHDMADDREYSRLFESLLTDTNLIKRELLLDRDNRRVPNYRDILQYMERTAADSNLDFSRLVGHLRELHSGEAEPVDRDADQQRIVSDRSAVQLMTIHKSKGLEAEVVFVLGGYNISSSRYPTHFHDENGQRIQCIEAPDENSKQKLQQEVREETERLLYVAMTRAKSQLYLPYYSSETYDSGLYRSLFRRLNDIIGPPNEASDMSPNTGFEVHDLVSTEPTIQNNAESTADRIPDNLLASETDRSRPAILRNERVQVMTSYSRLTQRRKDDQTVHSTNPILDGDIDEIETEPDPLAEPPLPPGKESGLYLHDLFENVDMSLLQCTDSIDDWRANPEVDRLFDVTSTRYGIEEDGRTFASRIVYRGLNTPMVLSNAVTLPALSSLEALTREPEFLIPIPEDSHPSIAEEVDGEIDIHRGYIRGFIDVIFDCDGKVYFGDWKSNLLDGYDGETVRDITRSKYETQIYLYTLAVVRMLGIRDEETYHERFGGALYLFIRAFEEPGQPLSRGIHHEKPSWSQLVNIYRRMTSSRLAEVLE
jgi:exodeoxyribonuclease V beta subunit